MQSFALVLWSGRGRVGRCGFAPPGFSQLALLGAGCEKLIEEKGLAQVLKKFALTAGVFLIVGALVFGVGSMMEPASGVHALGDGAACPVAGCTGECHGYEDVPQPDGVHEMTCPEAGCASVECHAWDTLQGRYHQASDASMNLWILAPVALVVGLIALIGALSRPARGEVSGEVRDER